MARHEKLVIPFGGERRYVPDRRSYIFQFICTGCGEFVEMTVVDTGPTIWDVLRRAREQHEREHRGAEAPRRPDDVTSFFA